MPQHSDRVIAEDDVVLRVTFPEFFDDFSVQVVARVFGFPVTQRHTQFVQQRPVHRDVGFGGGLERVLGQKNQTLLLAPGFKQVFEGFPHNRFTGAAAYAPDDVELLEVVIDQ